VLVRLYEALRFERPQMVEHPLPGHPHRFRKLRRGLRPLEQMEEPQPYRLQGRPRARRVIDDVEMLSAHADKNFSL
jgi:hypothetical protein